jgi:ribonuclease HI
MREYKKSLKKNKYKYFYLYLLIFIKMSKTQPSISSFFMDKTSVDYYLYTDGACSKNGSTDAKAGIGIYFGPDDPRNISKRIDGKQTNNTAELTAIIEAYPIIEQDILSGKSICIVSDSEYAIRCVTSYGEKCAKKGWNLDMPNKELVKEIYELYKNVKNISFIHIRAHTGNTDIHSLGNAGADELANRAIMGETSQNTFPYQNRSDTVNTIRKVYLNVPFVKKDEAKKEGAKWDPTKKKWYILENHPKKDEFLSNFPIHE